MVNGRSGAMGERYCKDARWGEEVISTCCVYGRLSGRLSGGEEDSIFFDARARHAAEVAVFCVFVGGGEGLEAFGSEESDFICA